MQTDSLSGAQPNRLIDYLLYPDSMLAQSVADRATALSQLRSISETPAPGCHDEY
jgi:hypothetical protein